MSTAVEETIDWLKADPRLEKFTVSSVVPSKRPDRLILVQRAGGETTMFVDKAGLVIDIQAPTQLEASRTGEGPVKDRLFALPERPNVGQVSIESMFAQATADGRPQYEINVRVVSLIG